MARLQLPGGGEGPCNSREGGVLLLGAKEICWALRNLLGAKFAGR